VYSTFVPLPNDSRMTNLGIIYKIYFVSGHGMGQGGSGVAYAFCTLIIII